MHKFAKILANFFTASVMVWKFKSCPVRLVFSHSADFPDTSGRFGEFISSQPTGMMSKNPNTTHDKQGFVLDSELIQDVFLLRSALIVISHQNGGRKTSGDKCQQSFWRGGFRRAHRKCGVNSGKHKVQHAAHSRSNTLGGQITYHGLIRGMLPSVSSGWGQRTNCSVNASSNMK